MTDLAAHSTAPEFQGVTVKTGPLKPPQETKKTTADTAKRSEGPKPPGDEQPQFASAQQFADAMVDHMDAAFGQYVKQPLQLTGAATKVNLNADGLVEEVWFQPQVDDLKLGVKKQFAINCRLTKPVPVAGLRVGATVTIRGRLTGGSLGLATLNECVIIASADGPSQPPDKPGLPAKPSKEPLVVKADEFGKDLYEGKQTAYARYARQPLQIEGIVHEQKLALDGGVAEVIYQLDVKELQDRADEAVLDPLQVCQSTPGRRQVGRPGNRPGGREKSRRTRQAGRRQLHRQECDDQRVRRGPGG